MPGFFSCRQAAGGCQGRADRCVRRGGVPAPPTIRPVRKRTPGGQGGRLPCGEEPPAVGRLRSAYRGRTGRILTACSCRSRKRLVLVGRLGSEDDAFRDALVSGAADHPMTVRDYCLSQGTPLAVEYYYRAARYGSGRAIWGIDDPAPTIRTGSRSPLPPGYRSHRLDSTTDLKRVRVLTLREASLVQTFPASWDWCNTRLEDRWLMVANAVPPRLGHHLGQVLRLSQE